MLLLVAIFFAVPIIIYSQFLTADEDRRRLLLGSLETQGRVIAESLRPTLSEFTAGSARELGDVLERLGQASSLKIKLLFRPADNAEAAGFFYIASQPQVPTDYLDRERSELMGTGILARLRDSCEGDRPLAERFVNPAGEEEVLTSIIPVNTAGGCWAVITSHASQGLVGAMLARSYWESPEVQFAAAIYVVMAIMVLTLFFGAYRSLRRFGQLARQIRTTGRHGGSFNQMNRVPELAPVAEEFDRLVEGLQSSSDAMRRAAEENAHAFKTPIAIIAQSLEPLNRRLRGGDPRDERALELIERALERLDTLVSAARRIEEETAELVDPPREPVELSNMIGRMLEGYHERFAAHAITIEPRIDKGVRVLAGEELLETVAENLLDNAISFSPKDSKITVEVQRNGQYGELRVADRGPGVDGKMLDQIFDRYFSSRPPEHGGSHFGIGLWLVRRNVEAVGGRVQARNRVGGGLEMMVFLPLSA